MSSSKMIKSMIITIASEYRDILLLTLEHFECDTDAILEQWDKVVEEKKVMDTHSAMLLENNKRGGKRTKKTGPKRPKSAYIFFCQDKRSEVKESNPTMKATDVTKELGMMWNEIKETDEAEQYIELAKGDKNRYNDEVENTPPVSTDDEDQKEDGKKKRKKKAKNEGPKKPKSAYIFFCQDKRAEVKVANPDMKPTEITSELGRLWNKIKETKQAKKYVEMANEDKSRYNEDVPKVASSGEEKPKKQRKNLPKKKDNEEDKKPRAKTAYSLFCQDRMHHVEADFPNESKKDIRKRLSQMWKELKDTNPGAVEDYNLRVRLNDQEDGKESDAEENNQVESPVVPSREEPTVVLPLFTQNNTQVDEEDLDEEDLDDDETKAGEAQEGDVKVVEEEEDPELTGAKTLLEYLNNIKTQKAKRGYKFNKPQFLIDTAGELTLSEEIVEKINEFRDDKAKTLSVTYLEDLITLVTDTIESHD